MKLEEAIITLRAFLKSDEDYRQTWIDNLSVAIMDEYMNKSVEEKDANLHTFANKAAERFLDSFVISK